MNTEAKVLSVNGSSVVVEVLRQSACGGNCHDCSGCESKSMQIMAHSEIDVLPGDRVVLSSKNSAVLFGMFIVFILPLALPTIVYLMAARSGFGIILAGISLAFSIFLIWFLSKSEWYIRSSRPSVIQVKERGKK